MSRPRHRWAGHEKEGWVAAPSPLPSVSEVGSPYLGCSHLIQTSTIRPAPALLPDRTLLSAGQRQNSAVSVSRSVQRSWHEMIVSMRWLAAYAVLAASICLRVVQNTNRHFTTPDPMPLPCNAWNHAVLQSKNMLHSFDLSRDSIANRSLAGIDADF